MYWVVINTEQRAIVYYQKLYSWSYCITEVFVWPCTSAVIKNWINDIGHDIIYICDLMKRLQFQVFQSFLAAQSPSSTDPKQTDAQIVLEQPWKDKSPHFYCWAWCYIAEDIPLFSWDQLSQLCPPSFLCSPASSLVGWGEEQKRPWLSVSIAEQ